MCCDCVGVIMLVVLHLVSGVYVCMSSTLASQNQRNVFIIKIFFNDFWPHERRGRLVG
jgi:hypothetical protein